MKRRDLLDVTCSDCSVEFKRYRYRMEECLHPLCCRKCSKRREALERYPRHTFDVSTAQLNHDAFEMVDARGVKLPVKAVFTTRCIVCEHDLKTNLQKERAKKHAWHCKSCAVTCEWADAAYREAHREPHWNATHSDAFRARISQLSRLNWANSDIRARMLDKDWSAIGQKAAATRARLVASGERQYKVWHGKHVTYADVHMKSTYEMRFAQVLDALQLQWEYEPMTFQVAETLTYTPDFWLPDVGIYVEVKGWWREDAHAKFTAFNDRDDVKCALVMKQQLEELEEGKTTIEACVLKTGWR